MLREPGVAGSSPVSSPNVGGLAQLAEHRNIEKLRLVFFNLLPQSINMVWVSHFQVEKSGQKKKIDFL